MLNEAQAQQIAPAGYAEYQARNAIRDLVRIYGFEAARELLAFYIVDEAERSARRVQPVS